MAALTLRKTSWCLQSSRSSRLFSVSLTTALPRRARQRQLFPPLPTPLQAFSPSRHRTRYSAASPVSRSAKTSRHYTNTNAYRQQQAAVATSPKSSPIDPPSTAQAVETLTPNTDDLSQGLNDGNLELDEKDTTVDWTRSFDGLSKEAFSPEAAKILTAPVSTDDIEIKSDGVIYLPEIKYRRILNQAFGPGGWGLAPRGETIVTSKAVTREYALVVLGRCALRVHAWLS